MDRLTHHGVTLLLLLFVNCYTPACLLHASCHLHRMFHDGPGSLPGFILTLSLAESIFYAFFLLRHRKIVRDNVPPPMPTPAQRSRMWREAMMAMEHESREKLEDWIRAWFVPTANMPATLAGKVGRILVQAGLASPRNEDSSIQMSQIRRGNIEEWLAGVFFHLPLKAVLRDPLLHHVLLSKVFDLEHKRNRRFESGYNESIGAIRPALDDLKTAHRPLVFYLAVAMFTGVIDAVLWLAGYRYHASGSDQLMGYHYHAGATTVVTDALRFVLGGHDTEQADRDTHPVVFLHGIGGYAPHIGLLLYLVTTGRPVYIVHEPHVSFKLAFKSRSPPSLTRMASSIESMLDQHQGPGSPALIIAHSLGSALAAALAPSSRYRFHHLLIDPISIMPFHPHLTRAFSTSQPVTALHRILRYFTLEIGIAQYVARQMNPFEGILPIHLEPARRERIRVIVAERDCLLAVGEIVRHCQLVNIDCEVLKEMDHGGYIINRAAYAAVQACVKQSIKEMSDDPPTLDLTETSLQDGQGGQQCALEQPTSPEPTLASSTMFASLSNLSCIGMCSAPPLRTRQRSSSIVRETEERDSVLRERKSILIGRPRAFSNSMRVQVAA